MKSMKNIPSARRYGLLEKRIPSKILISLKNIPNGGIPEIARYASKKSQPVLGNIFKTDLTLSTSRVL